MCILIKNMSKMQNDFLIYAVVQRKGGRLAILCLCVAGHKVIYKQRATQKWRLNETY